MPEKKQPTPKTVISPNLLPSEAREELYCQTIGETVKKIVQISFAMLMVFWLAGGILLWRINQEKDSLARDLETNVDSKKLQELKKMNQQFSDLRSLNAKVDKSLQKDYHFSEVLAELTKIVPQGVVLTSFETFFEQPGWIKIKGLSQNRDGFIGFKNNVEKSKFYEKVDSPLSNYTTPESLNFELDVLLRNWKPAWTLDMKKKTATPNSTDSGGNDNSNAN